MKISIIGMGTAGAISISDFRKEIDRGVEIDWYFDPNIKTQPVGEGTTLSFPDFLYTNLDLRYDELTRFNYTPKEGINYYNWGTKNPDYSHPFNTGRIGIHFNAVKFQEYVHDFFKNHKNVNIIEKNISANDVDGDYVIDCSGKPLELEDSYNIPEFICVNAVHVTQCYWEYPRFLHTKTIARPYGWVFMVPLDNRCSVGYLYNRNFNSIEEVKQDVKEIFDDWNLEPSLETNSFQFNNYYKKEMLDGRVFYNGNKGFFLEPMEATSIDTMLVGLDLFKAHIHGMISKNQFNTQMARWFKEIEFIIMIHYAAGSKWKNDFWEYAEERGKKCIEKCLHDPIMYSIIQSVQIDEYLTKRESVMAHWPPLSFKVNLEGLGLEI